MLIEFFDSHCHLQDDRFAPDRDAVIKRFNGRVAIIGSDLQSSQQAVALAEQYANLFAVVGVHPSEAAELRDPALVRTLAQSSKKVIAIGEIGLDYYHQPHDSDEQRRAFIAQIGIAQELALPIVLHARDAAVEVLDLIAPFMQNGGRAVWHCFSAPKKQLAQLTARALALNLYIGISGMITYEEQRALCAIIKTIPDRHLLLDTDAPYLIPRPRELDRNEPAQCRRIAEKLAEIRGVTLADIARITTRNAETFFGLTGDDSAKIVYPIRDSLYINLTAQCNNHCVFCARNRSYVVKGHDLALAVEPSAEEITEAIDHAFTTTDYREIVFCGLGEPTMRLPELLTTAKHCQKINKPVRLNTNGLANLQYRRDITPELRGVIDAVSISLNALNAEQYMELCQSNFGERAFAALQDFARACLREKIDTTLTMVDLPEIDLEIGKKIAAEIGAKFRVRSFIDAG